MEGKCLCGSVSFRLFIDDLKIYQCFCSLCQKQSGTESNLATIVPEKKFEFLSGIGAISSWAKDTGFTSYFCKYCGSPVPNRLRNKAFFWVPVGLLNSGASGKVTSRIYTDSKRNIICDHEIEEFGEFPDGGIDSHINKISGSSRPLA